MYNLFNPQAYEDVQNWGLRHTERPETTMGQGVGSSLPMGVEVNLYIYIYIYIYIVCRQRETVQ